MRMFSKLIFGLTLGGCIAFGPAASAQNPNDDNGSPSVVHTPAGDANMVAARQQSRDRLDQFWNAKDQCDTCEGFVLKVAFETDDGSLEHMWVEPISRREGTIFGVLQNEPVSVSRLEYLDDVEFTTDDITDWTYTQNGKAEGHFTTKVLFKDVSEEERAYYGDMLGWTKGIDY